MILTGLRRTRTALRQVGPLLRANLTPGPRVLPVGARPDQLPPAPEVAVFRDIQMIPPLAAYAPVLPRDRHGMCCGPVWPDDEARPWVRHNLRGIPMDRRPVPVDGPLPTIDRPCLWIGYVRPHFGHLVAEHLTRLLWSRYLRPDDACVLAAAPSPLGLARWPAHLWDVLAWHGLDRRRVLLLSRPTLAREVRVLPQAEQYLGPGPDAAYLDLLDLHVGRSGLVPVPSEVLYVARLGLLAQGTGGHVGERYLASRLAARGVRLLDPATAPLRQQLALYAGARTIVFAEGSAVHGRQLLGRSDQAIVVLNRRPGARIAETALAPRCACLDHVEATRAVCVPVQAKGLNMSASAISFYDVDALLGGLARHGVDLAPGWSAADYRAACEADVAAWSAMVRASPAKYQVERSLAALDAVPAGAAPDASGRWHRRLAPSPA